MLSLGHIPILILVVTNPFMHSLPVMFLFSLASQPYFGGVKMYGNLSHVFVDSAEILVEPIRLRCMNLRKLLLSVLAEKGSYWYFSNSYIVHYKQLHKRWIFYTPTTSSRNDVVIHV